MNLEKNESSWGESGHDDVTFLFREGGLSRDDGRRLRGEGGKNGDFWMTSFVNVPKKLAKSLNHYVKLCLWIANGQNMIKFFLAYVSNFCPFLNMGNFLELTKLELLFCLICFKNTQM